MIVKCEVILIARIFNTDFYTPVCFLGARRPNKVARQLSDQLQRELIVKPTVWK